MRAITLVGATPNRLRAIYSHLAEEGEAPQDRNRLASLIGPTSLARSEDAGEDNAFTDCLAVGSDLGIFKVEPNSICLAVTPKHEDTARAFEEEITERLVDKVTSATQAQGVVAGAIAWMLCQDPRVPLKWSTSASVTLRKQQFRPEIKTDFDMTNDSRFQQAVYWARALGFVTRSNLNEEIVIADPTSAIERRLDRVLPKGSEKLLSSFLAELSDCCPVFEGGSVRSEVEAMFQPDLRRDEKAVSGSTALALHRLKLRGIIDLRRLDDGRVLFVDGLLDDGRVSHISRK